MTALAIKSKSRTRRVTDIPPSPSITSLSLHGSLFHDTPEEQLAQSFLTQPVVAPHFTRPLPTIQTIPHHGVFSTQNAARSILTTTFPSILGTGSNTKVFSCVAQTHSGAVTNAEPLMLSYCTLIAPAPLLSGSQKLDTIVCNAFDCDQLYRFVSYIDDASPPPAQQDVFADFEDYQTPNWDGYDADPIMPKTVDAARSFLRLLPSGLGEPHIAPGADGTIGFEWLSDEGPFRKLFIDIGPGYLWRAYWRRANGETGTIPHQHIDDTTSKTIPALYEKLIG